MTTTEFLKLRQDATETGARQSSEAVHMSLYDAYASPQSERRRTASPLDFGSLPDLETLAKMQGVPPIKDINDLATDDWPEDESVEDFIASATEGRHEEDEPDS